MEVLAELEARHPENRKAVEATLVHQQVEDRERIGPEVLGTGRLEPGQHLPLGCGEPVQDIQQVLVPGPGGEDELVGLVGVAAGADADAAFEGLPFEDFFVAVDLRPLHLRRHDVGDDAPLGGEETAVGLYECQVLRREVVAGIAPVQLGASEYLVRQVVEPGRLPRALEDPGVLRSGVYGADGVQKRSPAKLCIPRHSS